MDSEEGVMSLPFRLAISMLIVSLALPICLQSISDGEREVSHRLARQAAQEISRIAEELSSKPVGESRMFEVSDDLRSMGSGISIVAGSLLGEDSFSSIRCTDATGWAVVVFVQLSPQIVGFCSFDLMPLTIDRNTGDILISHGRHACGEIIQLGPA